MRRFAAPFDGVVVGITFFVLALSIFMVALFTMASPLLGVIVLLPIAFGLWCAWVWCPTGYTVEPGRITVHRRRRDRHVPLNETTFVEPFERWKWAWGWRVGGLFGIYGEFRPTGKKLYVAGRRMKPTIAVTTGDNITVVMPENPEEFVAAVAAASLPVR